MKIIRISAIWCSSCLIMRPRFEQLKEVFKDIEHIEYDYDFDIEVEKYNVGLKLPVLILVEDDKEITRIVGEKTIDELINQLKGCVK